MRIVLACVGRLKDGPERALYERYVSRLGATGRGVALGPLSLAEVPESRASDAAARMADEAKRLGSAAGEVSLRVVLDEEGKQIPSGEFAKLLGGWRDAGQARIGFFIGGADGHGAALLDQATLKLSLGRMTLPHGLARVVLVEQLYRAASILAGHPYHRA